MDESEARDAVLREMAVRLGIELHDPDLYDRALTHASMVAESEEVSGDYEALEFLGDAVLGLAIAHRLIELAPDRSPGEYSRLRAGLVNRSCVARVAQTLEIGPAIRLGKGEESSGGRERTALLADCLEALLAAVYLDAGWVAAKAFVDKAFAREVEDALQLDRVWDFKSLLQNYCQAQRIALPRFSVVSSEGPDHKKEFEVEVFLRDCPAGRGRGPSKKEAEQQAARAALEREGQMLG